MIKNFNAYDYSIIRQQLFKFLDEKDHLVKTMIQDKI
jgi:hypothetical protein